MGKLEDLIEKFTNDSSWNSENRDGTHRFDKKIKWIESMVKDYAEKLGMSTDEVVDLVEGKRDYSWPNYYQEANFPGVDSESLYGIWDTFDDFVEESQKRFEGFKCPKCGDISPSPQECIHRIKKDGKCDWCSFGLFKSGKGVIIKENGLAAIPIFEPVAKKDGESE